MKEVISYNFSLIGSNNACSDNIFIITNVFIITIIIYVDHEQILNVIKIIKQKWDQLDRSGSGK